MEILKAYWRIFLAIIYTASELTEMDVTVLGSGIFLAFISSFFSEGSGFG